MNNRLAKCYFRIWVADLWSVAYAHEWQNDRFVKCVIMHMNDESYGIVYYYPMAESNQTLVATSPGSEP